MRTWKRKRERALVRSMLFEIGRGEHCGRDGVEVSDSDRAGKSGIGCYNFWIFGMKREWNIIDREK